MFAPCQLTCPHCASRREGDVTERMLSRLSVTSAGSSAASVYHDAEEHLVDVLDSTSPGDLRSFRIHTARHSTQHQFHCLACCHTSSTSTRRCPSQTCTR